MAKKLIAVVDMVNGFIKEGALSFPAGKDALPAIEKLLKENSGADVVYLCDRHTAASAEFSSFPPHCHTETESAVIAELAKYPGITVYKNSISGLFKMLESGIKIAGYSEAIICGVCTDICVLSLALGLKAYADEQNIKLRVSVVKGACRTFDLPGHCAADSEAAAYAVMATNGINLID